MTRLNLQLNGPDKAINFAQGFPDFATDPRIVESAARAMRDGFNQYATTWGAPQLRNAIAAKQSIAWGREVDPETEVTVSCGATEAMIAAMLAAVDPGDEVVIFEPFYENYGPDCIISGAVPRYVTLRAPDWAFDPDELRAAFSGKTRAIVVNTPHNPTGKVFSRPDLELIATTRLQSPTRSMNTWSIAANTSALRRCPAWPIEPSPSAARARRFRSLDGGWAG
jgi:aminotransferase